MKPSDTTYASKKYKPSYTILCVDDIPENLYAYEVILGKLDHVTVIKAESGSIALKILLREQIDLILLDIQMPEMDGYEVAQLIKSNHGTENIPIIFITAVFKQDEFIAKGFSLGAVDYLTKPLDDNLLLNRIKLYLSAFLERDQATQTMQMFYDVVQGIGDGLYVLNQNGTLKFINDSALSMLGYERFELIGRPFHDMVHSHDKNGRRIEPQECPVYQTFKTKKTHKIPYGVYRRKDGVMLPVTAIATPIIKHGTVEAVVTLMRDITKDLEYKSLQEKRLGSKNDMIFMLVEAIDKRDPYTAGHTQRVAQYCQKIAKQMEYSQEEIDKLVDAAHLHDVGKISTPDSVLLKPNHFDEEEYDIMKLHLETGFNLISTVKEYREIAEIMRYHHERYDGKGYPLGLFGNAIPPIARIMIVADAFDAMTTNRVYKKRKSVEETLTEINELREIQFHPEVVDAALIALKDVVIGEYLDQQPHNFLEEKRFAYFYHDRLSGCFNLDYLAIVLDIHYHQKDAPIIKIELKNMNMYNSKYGWETGNELISKFGQYLREETEERYIFRFSGDDFIILSEKKDIFDEEKTQQFFKNFDSMLGATFTHLTIGFESHDYESLKKQLLN